MFIKINIALIIGAKSVIQFLEAKYDFGMFFLVKASPGE